MRAINFERDELATILAALRYWQRQGLADDPELRSDTLHEIATQGGGETSLTGDSIDDLCERLYLASIKSAGSVTDQ